MKLSTAVQLLGLSTLAFAGQANAWTGDKDGDKKQHHNSHSVQTLRTSHRAKTTYISHSLVDVGSSKSKDIEQSTVTKISTGSGSVAATTAAPTALCTHILPGTKDTEAIREPGTNIIFREKCGITEQAVQECPYLCGPVGSTDVKACFDRDINLFGSTGANGCVQCLPPCPGPDETKSSSKHPTKDETKTLSATIKPSPTSVGGPSCTTVASGVKDTPAVAVPDSPGSLTRQSCGLTNDTVEACPYLCGRDRNDLVECFDYDFAGLGPQVGFPLVQCKKCLPIC